MARHPSDDLVVSLDQIEAFLVANPGRTFRTNLCGCVVAELLRERIGGEVACTTTYVQTIAGGYYADLAKGVQDFVAAANGKQGNLAHSYTTEDALAALAKVRRRS